MAREIAGLERINYRVIGCCIKNCTEIVEM